MIFIIGLKTVIKQLWRGFITCPRCLQSRQHLLIERTEWGTMFFIQIIPLRRERILNCNYCNTVRKLTKAEAADLMASVPGAMSPGR